jgi:hypothetical protein
MPERSRAEIRNPIQRTVCNDQILLRALVNKGFESLVAGLMGFQQSCVQRFPLHQSLEQRHSLPSLPLSFLLNSSHIW